MYSKKNTTVSISVNAADIQELIESGEIENNNVKITMFSAESERLAELIE